MQFTDAAPISGVRMTRDGYAVAEVRAARTGIQRYTGAEVGKPELATVDVYRPPESVFSTDSLASYAHKPVTFNHPANDVTAATWKELAVGNIGGEVARDGDFVKVPLALMDATAIAAVQDGTREISMGYLCDLVFEDGQTPGGETYQAIQRDIRINHLAIVPKGRAGPHCRIGDRGVPDAEPFLPLNLGDRHMALKTIIVDGLPVETTDAGEAAITKLRGQITDAATAAAALTTAHDVAMAAKDAELGKKDAEIADLKTKVVDGAALDALVADRSAVVTKAKALDAKILVDGKSNIEIKRSAVASKLGDEKVKDKSDDYVGALFDHLTADLKAADPLREIIADGLQPTNDELKAVGDARAAMLADLTGEKAA